MVLTLFLKTASKSVESRKLHTHKALIIFSHGIKPFFPRFFFLFLLLCHDLLLLTPSFFFSSFIFSTLFYFFILNSRNGTSTSFHCFSQKVNSSFSYLLKTFVYPCFHLFTNTFLFYYYRTPIGSFGGKFKDLTGKE